MGRIYQKNLSWLLAGMILFGFIGSEKTLLGHTQAEYRDWCTYLKDNRDRANDRDRLIEEQRLWRNYDNEVASIYSTYDSDTWTAWQNMAAAEVTYELAVIGCAGSPPCLTGALGVYLLAVAGIQGSYQTALNTIENTKNENLLAANNTLQSGLTVENNRHTNQALAISLAWIECNIDADHHTNPH